MKRLLLLALLAATAALPASAQTFPEVSIHDLQFASDQALSTGNDSSAYDGDTVVVEGVVIFNPCLYGLSTSASRLGTWLQDPAGGPWSGVHVMIDPVATGLGSSYTLQELNDAVLFQDNFVVGNKVKATGIVSDFQGDTRILLLPIQSEVTQLGAPIPPAITLAIDTFEVFDGSAQVEQEATGEKYEGVYVELTNVTVVDVAPQSNGRIFWSVQDVNGNKIGIHDASGFFRNDTSDNFCTAVGSFTPAPFDTPQVNATLAYLRGIIVQKTIGGVSQYSITPLTPSDMGPQVASAPVVSNVVEVIPVPTTSQDQTITATITDIDGNVTTAELFYAIGFGSVSFTSVSMTNTSGDTWSGTIPAVSPDSTYVIYYIAATDDQGNVTNYPNTAATNSYYLVLNGGINSISDVQFNPIGGFDSPLNNAHLTGVSINGTVMSSTGLNDLGLVVIQDGNAPWSGITLKGPGINGLQRGQNINITAGKVIEDFTVTKLDSITFTVTSSGNPLPAPVVNLDLDSVRLGIYNYSEPYESMLLEYTNVFVNNTNPDAPGNFGEWSIANTAAAPAGLRVDDYSNDVLPHAGFNVDSLTQGEQLAYIRGILIRSFGNWKIMPRNKDDIAGFFTVTSVNDVNAYKAIDVYPNPASDELRIRFIGKTTGDANWTMMDATGRVLNNSVVHVNNGATYVVPMESFAAGVYFIRVQTTDGVQTVQVVKN